MKRNMVLILIGLLAWQVVLAEEGKSKSPETFLKKSVSIKANAMFELVAGPLGNKPGGTVSIGMYPPMFSKHGAFNGAGYLQTFKIKIKDKEAHPAHSENKSRLLTHIGGCFMREFGVRWRNITDSSMSKAVGSSGYVRLFQGKRIVLTLILMPTDDKDVFVVCGTFAEVELAIPKKEKK